MPRGVPSSKEDRELVRQRIFEAATQLFLTQGFHRTSMRQIAAAVGMGKSTLYDYFNGKADIVLYFAEDYLSVINRSAAEVAGQAMSAPEKLRHVFRAQWAYVRTHREMTTLLAQEASGLGRDTNLRLAGKRMEYQRILETIIRQGIAEGTFRAVDPIPVALALHGVMARFFYEWLYLGESSDSGVDTDALVDLFLYGIVPR